MIELTPVHFAYFFIVLLIIITMAFKKDTVLPCILGIFTIGYMSSESIVKGVQTVYNALITAGNEFWSIILVISIIVAMSRALRDIGADELMMMPIKKIMINPGVAFFALGFVMLFFSLFVWPSPAVALVGAIILPAALKSGLPPIWAAVAMNIFGHGIGLSGDYFIQGAPAITAKAANTDTYTLIKASIPLWLVMSIVTVITSFFTMKKEIKNYTMKQCASNNVDNTSKPTIGVYFISIITPLLFLLNIYIMYKYKLKGNDATALIGGTAVLIMSIATIVKHNFINSFEKITDYVREGFIFGIKIFAPVIIIGAFFFLGSETSAKDILGPNATGLLSDLGLYLADKITLSKFPISLIQMIVGGITGLDGSGFSGLPLVGSLAHTFSSAITINKDVLASLGHLTTIWVGGGTIIPWGIIPVAAICNVEPLELARKNTIPVIVGFIATFITALFLL